MYENHTLAAFRKNKNKFLFCSSFANVAQLVEQRHGKA